MCNALGCAFPFPKLQFLLRSDSPVLIYMIGSASGPWDCACRDVKPALYMDLALITGVVSAFAFLIGGYVSKLNG